MFFPGKVCVRTIAYVDGFDLYIVALRRIPNRWLDLQQLIELAPQATTTIESAAMLLQPQPVALPEGGKGSGRAVEDVSFHRAGEISEVRAEMMVAV